MTASLPCTVDRPSSRARSVRHPCPIRRLGTGEQHHFFGYYNKTAWDRSGRYVLGNEVAMMDAPLTPNLPAKVGYFDLQDGESFRAIDTTTAWNWQMGCQLQWLDGLPGRKLIYNTRSGNPRARYPGFGAIVFDIDSGRKTALPMPVYVCAPNSRYALCVDYRRLYITHETIGYSEQGAPFALPLAPADDGIHRMDLATGATALIVSYDDLRRFHYVASMEHAIHWVSHIEINPSSSRVLLLHRWTERTADETCFLHRLITMNPDGSDMRLLECSDHPLPQLAADFDPCAAGTFDYEKSEYQISHPLWQDDSHIVVWSPHAGSIHYHLYEDREDGRVQVIGRDVLVENGHMSFSPVDKRWLLSDTYPDSQTNTRILFLYDMHEGTRYEIGEFYAPPDLKKENRCDLHPRWKRDGSAVCIDSVHEGARQMYVIDVSHITSGH
ncbi:hypothetical protein [Paraburkholderia phenoliruptrix]|uniref:hypothetical protein n=1 Tax=Paraburkholderia phenoliruptrix TaxID=252970 RepID=UPI001C4F596F|nr:hypothetical protein [Paraburkholderia phenoliruptrix]MBW0446756.1 hypothetical protein [Paraburkholderia phenoliruptrix]MBW9099252.1 hypothetical protein [Paraburkholderia phenoliruptrix]